MKKIIAKKSLGQNFLKDETILKKIANSFVVSQDDVVIEIGSGMGALTKYLVQLPARLFCYEVDLRMKEFLYDFQSDRVTIFFTDFLKRDFKSDLPKSYQHLYILANLPYYITTPIILHILNCNISVDGMTLLVQKEVALRFCALPKSKDYGYFTVLLQHFFQMEYLCDVPPTSFTPSPKVTSAVVRFTKKENSASLDFVMFQNFLKEAFAMKRKTLKNNLKDYDLQIINDFFEKKGFLETVRAEELSYEDFKELFLKLF